MQKKGFLKILCNLDLFIASFALIVLMLISYFASKYAPDFIKFIGFSAAFVLLLLTFFPIFTTGLVNLVY